MKRRKAPLKKKTNKVVNKGYKPPKWFNAIPYGSHGSTPAQKRYWWVVSQTYRQQDWEKYGGRCVSCGQVLEDWKYGQLGHYKPYGVCNSWFKFERKNLGLQCPGCNMGIARNSRADIGHAFGEELKRRFGSDILDWIETTNRSFTGQKMETWDIVEKVRQLRPDLVYEE